MGTGLRIGWGGGIRPGEAVGVGRDPIAAGGSGAIAGVTRDTLSNVYCPANATEWTALMTAAGLATGNPSSCWLFQEASGNILDKISTQDLLPFGTVSYQQSETGWARKGGASAGVDSGSFRFFSGGGPNPALTSVLWLGYIDVTAQLAGNQRSLMAAGGTVVGTTIDVCLQADTHIPRVGCAGVLVTGSSDLLTGGVRPCALKYSRGLSEVKFYDDLEKVSGTFSLVIDNGTKGFGVSLNGSSVSCAFTIVYGCVFSGAAADLTDAQVKTLLTTLGWSIPWS